MERLDGNNARGRDQNQKNTNKNRTKRDRSFAGRDAHLNLKELGLARHETWIMPQVRKRSGMTGGVELVRKYDVA